MLNQRVKLWKPATGEDSLGQPNTGLDLLDEVWADVRFLKGLEAIKANAVTPLVQASIRIRYRADVDESMTVEYAGEMYNIKSALPDARREFRDLVCEAAQ